MGLKNSILSFLILIINCLNLPAFPHFHSPDLRPVSLKVNGNLNQNQTGSFTATLRNNGTAAYNSRLWIYMEKPDVYTPNQFIGGDIFYIAPGETKTITITGIVTLPQGTYGLNMIYDAGNNPNKMDTYQFHGADFGALSVNIGSDIKPTEQPQRIGTPDLKPVSLKVNGNLNQNQTGSFTATLRNNGTAAYNSRLWIYMEKPDVYTPHQRIGGDIYTIASGETMTITITGIVTLPQGTYGLNMVYDANNNSNQMDTYQFHGADFGALSVNIGSDIKTTEQPTLRASNQVGNTNRDQQGDIVGMWKGSYGHGMELTLIIYDDMKGESSCFLLGTIASHTVLAGYSDGSYNIIGEKWINRPNGPMGSNFVTLRGDIKNDVFSGKDFQLKRVATAKQVQEQRGESERQIAEREKQQQTQQAQQNRKNTIIIIIAIILFVLFSILPKELQRSILKFIGVIVVILLTILTLGIFRGFRNWKYDR